MKKLDVYGYLYERHENCFWYQITEASAQRPRAERMITKPPCSAALDRIAELEPLAKFGLAVAKAWRDVHDYADIDGDIIQEAAEEAGLMVDVPAGTHDECAACEDGAVPCRGLRLP